MKRPFGPTLLLVVAVLIGSVSASAQDADADSIPDPFDNCLLVPNGPGELSNQIDTDLDGFGNACDADYGNDGLVDLADGIPIFGGLAAHEAADANVDIDGDGHVTVADWLFFVLARSLPPGPSGLACAGSIPCP